MTIAQGYYRTACSGRRKRRVRNHLLDRLDAGDRFFRKREAKGHRAEQLAIDVNGTPAHPLQDSGLLQGSAAQTSQYDALFWSEILEYAEDLDLKIFDAIVMEDSAADAAHPWFDVLETEKAL
jgi:hypothetical protein